MKINKLLAPSVISAFTILVVLSLFSSSTLATIGTPHIVYGKVFTSSGIPPGEANLEIYSYIPARPGEILDKSSVGCGYDVFLDGWLWVEAGNYDAPWAISENLRIIAIDNFSQETGVADLVLNSSGNQLLLDLNLKPGDNVGPRAYNAMVNGSSPASVPGGTASITLTATVDDSICGNNVIQAGEYFVDTDPGLGSGTAMAPEDGSFNSTQEKVTTSVNTYSWTEGSTHTLYVRGRDFSNNWGTTHKVAVSITKSEKIRGDLDGDGDVDNDDLNILLYHRNQPASVCPDCDLDGDGMITALDARKLVLLCTRPRCVTK